jgi:predicted RNase H-like nuclease (RuvC/YqgF family)
VERRLSVDVPPEDTIPEYNIDLEEAIRDTREEIFIINTEIEELKENNSKNIILEEKLIDLDSQLTVLKSHITEIKEENSRIHEQLEQKHPPAVTDIEPLTVEIKNEISQLNMRLEKAENHNRINIGSVKVPVELSGVVGALILVITGILITGGHWDIIRSANFSFAIALVFATAVFMKFYMVNNKNV